MAIHNYLRNKGLQLFGVLKYQDFLSGEKKSLGASRSLHLRLCGMESLRGREMTFPKEGKSRPSAGLGFEPIFVDSHALDLRVECFRRNA